MKQLQKWGGAAALFEALAYIIGFIGFILDRGMLQLQRMASWDKSATTV